MINPHDITAQLLSLAGLPLGALDHLSLTGQDPVLPSTFAVGTAAQTSIAAAGLAAASLWQQRTGQWQSVAVDMRHAAAECRSERYLLIDGQTPTDPWDDLAGTYQCGDGRWVRLHTNFPHHRAGVVALLGCADNKAGVTQALLGWQAEDFEAAATARGMVVAAMRSFTEWDAHPQAAALRDLPLLTLEKIGDAPPRTWQTGLQPLSGIKVLDFTRIIAGPVCGRTLAGHGADVLLITSPKLPSIPILQIDTGRGKRNTQLDLHQPADQATLRTLIGDADVFMQGYRPGGLAGLGFSPETVAAHRPGIVYASLSAYGHCGPWANKRGFDSLVQTATGFNHAEAQAAGSDQPRPFPMQILDHATGYLMALGTMAALHRQTTEGGSWHVRVSLAQTGAWLRQLGRIDQGLACPDWPSEAINDLRESCHSGYGQLSAIRHAAQLDATPFKLTQPAMPLGHGNATW